MEDQERSLLEALRARAEAERLLRNLDALDESDSVADSARRELRQEYVDRILAAEHEIAGLKDELSAELGSLQGERAQRLRAIVDAETTPELEAALGIRHSSRRASTAAVPPASTSVARPRSRVRSAIVGLAAVGIIAVVLLRWGLPALESVRGVPTGGPEETTVHISLQMGDRITIGSGQVSADGGTLSVGGTGGPLDGLTLDVPSGAYVEPATFTLSFEPIEGFDAPEGVDILTPLIHLDASTADHAGDLIALTIPVDVPEGQFASLFVYDGVTRTLKGLPTLEESDGTLTMLGTHFCPIVALSAPYERLVPSPEKMPANLDDLKVPTGFRPNRDTWNLANAGSVVASGGYCRGMSLTSLYHYMVEGGAEGSPLFRKEYDNGLPEGMSTPGFWQDDRFAIQLCSLASTLGTTREAGNVETAMAARIDRLSPERRLTNEQRQFYMTALALYVTGAPQLLGVHTGSGDSGHSLLCYGVDGHTLFIADPNYPGKGDIRIEYKDGVLGPYLSAQNAKDIAAGKYLTYDRIYYEGDISFFNLPKLERYWTDYEAGGLDSLFPRYVVKVTELDETGAAVRSYSLDALAGIETDAARVRFDLDSGTEFRLTLYRYGNPPSAISGNVVEFGKGDSYLGFLVEQKTKYGWEWADFNWVRVLASGEQPSTPASGQLSYNYCALSVEFDALLRDTYTGEVREKHGERIGCSLFGTFSGNTFTGRVDEVLPAAFPRDVGAFKARLSVTLDRDLDEVASFSFEEEWSYTCGGILRYTGTGSGAKRYMGGVGMYGLYLSGDESEGMPRPAITWLEREPAQGPECGSGYRTYELLSAENFSVLVQFMEREE